MRTAWRSEGSSAGNGRIEVKALSVRGITGSCLGVGGTFSVRRDVYGYVWGPMSRTLSLKSHLKLISGKAINLSLILVAHEPDFYGQFDQADLQRIQAAIDRMRELYGQIGLGVRNLYWQYIRVAVK